MQHEYQIPRQTLLVKDNVTHVEDRSREYESQIEETRKESDDTKYRPSKE